MDLPVARGVLEYGPEAEPPLQPRTGKRLLQVMFAVRRKRCPCGRWVMWLIMNLVPLNALLRLLGGDQ